MSGIDAIVADFDRLSLVDQLELARELLHSSEQTADVAQARRLRGIASGMLRRVIARLDLRILAEAS